MEALYLSSPISIASSKGIAKASSFKHVKIESKKRLAVKCQSDAIKSSGLSSSLTEASPLNVKDTLVLTPNGKDIAEMHDEGIGIANFLGGKSFFITGATGFLGKVLIEKILRTAPDVQKIFVLIKAKNEEAALQRLKNEIIRTELYQRLNQIHGKSYDAFMLNKLVPVVGNLCESNLGVNDDAVELMCKEVDVIINSAANTTFDERYDIALDTNTGGPTRLMGFAKKCQKLKLFLQVSTAYVNGQRQGRVVEKPFSFGESISVVDGNKPEFSVEDELRLMMESKEATEENSLVQKMKELGIERANKFGWQDTYAFTKAMGEMMIDSLKGDIPVVVIRPSIIESTYKEPFPGWMEGIKVMDPIILRYGKGQLTGFLVDPKGVLDVVPADMVVNATLAAIAKHGTDGKPETNIYQVASSAVNPLVFSDLVDMLYEHFTSSPHIDSSGTPVRVPTMKLFNSMEDFSSHLWKDALTKTNIGNIDGKLAQKLEILVRKSVEQAKHLAHIYKPYTFYSGRFDNSNTNRLMGCMSKEEKQEFGFDVEKIDWKDYIINVHIPGLRSHVMKGRGLSAAGQDNKKTIVG